MARIKLAEFGDLLVVQSAGRFVEQQQGRLAGERARKLDALARSERQAGRRPLGRGFQADEGEHGVRGCVELALFASESTAASTRR